MNKIFPILFCVVLTVSSCSLGAMDRGEQYMLSLPEIAADAIETHVNSNDLVVGFPLADGRLDTYRIALVKPDGSSDYFAQRRWVDFLPVIVQNTMTRSLENQNLYRNVFSDAQGLGDGLILKPTIRRFEAVYPAYMERPPETVIEIDFVLQDVDSEKTLQAFTLSAADQATANSTTAIYDSFKRSYQSILNKLFSALD